jgi:hypothetical protein
VSANTFASDPSNPNGPSTIAVRLIRNFGRPGQTEELMDVALEAQDKTKEELGRIRIE